MASSNGAYEPAYKSLVENAKVLVVGAGGVGCELLKNIVLAGFQNIDVIDLDTIDVSNLNRQFLFQKKHVGKPKAMVAKESALRYNSRAKIQAYHDSITERKYDVNFFKNFNLVINALDNRAARNHVNRMCLAADIPLIESGTAGYLGQVTLIKKGVTECYECQPKARQKVFPQCTIRNTPSEPIHCIVWAKHLFNQLFGEADSDEEVSPDTADPEAVGDAGKAAFESEANTERISTRGWAESCSFDTQKLFHKLFNDDIRYLLSMKDLWRERRPPSPLVWEELPDAVAGSSSMPDQPGLKDQKVWSIAECATIFSNSCFKLKAAFDKLPENDHMVWDKDDEASLDFVTACANIRAHIFGIAQKSKFDVKSMAGNIIPAIATTNAITAGLIVLQAFKVLEGKYNECPTIYLARKPNVKKQVLVPDALVGPSPGCFVCSPKNEVTVKLNPSQMTVKNFNDRILKERLNMIAPDVIENSRGTILISSEEGETDENNDKLLSDFDIKDGSTLKCDDFLQNFELVVIIVQCDKLDDGVEFEVVSDVSQLKPKEEENHSTNGATNGVNNVGTTDVAVADDDDLMLVDEDEEEAVEIPRKRKLSTEDDVPSKKSRISGESAAEVIVV